MISAIIVAAGKSERFGRNKMEVTLGGMPILMRTLFAFHIHPKIDEIILVTQKEKIEEYEVLKSSFSKLKNIIAGGEIRQQSSVLGVLEAKGNICLIHNGANPLVTQAEITQTIESTEKKDAAFVGRKVPATIRKIQKGLGIETLNREELVEVETPQGFRRELFLEAIQRCQPDMLKKTFSQEGTPCDMNFTDDIALLETLGIKSVFVEASPQNRKITTQYDLQCAEAFLKPHTRSGIGHDSHRFKDSQEKHSKIILGGVSIPHSKNFIANSDGDVVIHALCNAIGTAIGEGSLSRYADKMCAEGEKNSFAYLKYIAENMISAGYSIGNIAISIEGKEPKLEAHIKEMKRNIADALNINPFQIGIACTSGEELSSFGKGEGIQCFCSVQLIKI